MEKCDPVLNNTLFLATSVPTYMLYNRRVAGVIEELKIIIYSIIIIIIIILWN